MTNSNTYNMNSITITTYLLKLSTYTRHHKLNSTSCTHKNSTLTLSRCSVSTLPVTATAFLDDDITYLSAQQTLLRQTKTNINSGQA